MTIGHWHEHKFREILFEIWAAFRKSISKEISRNSGPNLGGIGVSFLFSKFTAFTLAVLLTTYGSYLLNSCGSRDLLAIFGGSDGAPALPELPGTCLAAPLIACRLCRPSCLWLIVPDPPMGGWDRGVNRESILGGRGVNTGWCAREAD